MASVEVTTVLVAKMKSKVSMEEPGRPREKKLGPHSATSVLITSCRNHHHHHHHYSILPSSPQTTTTQGEEK